MQIHELPSGTPETEDMIPFDTGESNYKTPFSGFDVGENTATFTSADEADPSIFKTVDPIETGPIKTVLNRLSMAVSNIRYIWKVLTGLVSKTAIINYDDSTGGFNIWHENTHRLILNSGSAGGNEMFRVDNGTTQIQTISNFGLLDIFLDTDKTYRIYMTSGVHSSYPRRMFINCYNQRFDLNPVDNASYWYVGPSGSRTSITIDNNTGRVNIMAAGGLYVNGSRVGN